MDTAERETDRPVEAAEPAVRPVGFVEDRAVVRRIGDRDCFLGNWRAADPDAADRRFDHVVSVTADAYPLTTHHRPLVDGPDNDWPAFEAAVDAARRCHRADGALLVHCKAGISRSTAVIATTLAVEEDRPLAETVAAVRDARPMATPHPALVEQAVSYLAAHR